MSSYENEVKENIKNNQPIPGKIDISIAKYFWESSIFNVGKKNTIPRFLRKMHVFKNFSDNELRILCQYLHTRNFNPGEMVFKQGQQGLGFYLIYSGHLDVIMDDDSEEAATGPKYILTLDKADYFGELALLQDNSIRHASVIAKEQSILLGLFKPDMDELINYHPVVAAKLLQSISTIVANRLYSVTQEVRRLKSKLPANSEGMGE